MGSLGDGGEGVVDYYVCAEGGQLPGYLGTDSGVRGADYGDFALKGGIEGDHYQVIRNLMSW